MSAVAVPRDEPVRRPRWLYVVPDEPRGVDGADLWTDPSLGREATDLLETMSALARIEDEVLSI